MRRAFEADVLACPKCGGRMIVLATIEDPAVIRRILTHLGLSMETGEAYRLLGRRRGPKASPNRSLPATPPATHSFAWKLAHRSALPFSIASQSTQTSQRAVS